MNYWVFDEEGVLLRKFRTKRETVNFTEPFGYTFKFVRPPKIEYEEAPF